MGKLDVRFVRLDSEDLRSRALFHRPRRAYLMQTQESDYLFKKYGSLTLIYDEDMKDPLQVSVFMSRGKLGSVESSSGSSNLTPEKPKQAGVLKCRSLLQHKKWVWDQFRY